MNKAIVLIAVLVLLVLISGCVQQAQNGQAGCGNGVCDSGETIDTCPADCATPPMPAAPGAEGAPPSLPF